ncbi:hypothetical protein METBIDRAFT_35940 [Metschnikowia bicuspidata var. bicuspidata NRRL YB-4993]|uniref:Uncharacterized protein n=1 Tax=Metschnikowia bicuspidata var. bicuspidata NRRL YB-4993 TaxID=869754 RepID=A0A1A0HJE4_9ASCO|nr:hypothetical protein METBIDRAFT_35940 [Metschnikowia bicuspidata var. bicuspidata NRRL YB-4993]OBA24007.1 hypothetical protein METBIDRAFT_35940 [Metschnikowia bicuspidata var. bicuspidata NRRL YB-4993]
MSDDYARALEIQRRNFEAQFGSLESMGFLDKTVQPEDSSSESEHSASGSGGSSSGDEDKFGGFDSASEEDSSDLPGPTSQRGKLSVTPKIGSVAKPKVVLLTEQFTPLAPPKKDRRLARSGRVPTIREQEEKQRQLSKLTKKQQQQAAKEDLENLENDLKLQRLLSESHILAHNVEHSGADLTLQTIDYEAPVGNARRRILDQRIREAAAVNSATRGLPKKLEKMPMGMRKGMIRARDNRVADYEREAKEAGIILSRVKKGEVRNLDQGRGATLVSDRLGVGKKEGRRIRDRGLRINSVGKSTRNGLRISQLEIDRVNNMGNRRRK